MAIRIAQIRKKNSQKYLENLEYEFREVNTVSSAGETSNLDLAIIRKNGVNFAAGEHYYLRMSIKRIPNEMISSPRERVMRFSLIFYNGNYPDGKRTEEEQQPLVDDIVVEPYLERVNSEYKTYEFILTPLKDFSYLCLKLDRVGYDYYVRPRTNFYYKTIERSGIKTVVPYGDAYSENKTKNKILTLDIGENENFNSSSCPSRCGQNGDLCRAINILDTPAVKIGVQSRPGLLLCVNGEPIRIGRSGIFEVNNGIVIQEVSIVTPNGAKNENVDPFLLDYSYKIKER